MAALCVRAESQYPDVAYGDTVEISETRTETSVTVAGRLVVTGGASAQTAATTIALGAPADDALGVRVPAVIEVRGGSFGSSRRTQQPTTVTIGKAGGRGALLVTGGELHAAVLSISKDTPTNETGYIEFARVEGGDLYLRTISNESAATGRVVVAGKSTIHSNHDWYPTMHAKGAFVYESENGAPIAFDLSNLRASFNGSQIPVLVRGNGDISIATHGSDVGNCLKYSAGACFDTTGTLTFSGRGTNMVQGSAIFGSRLKAVCLKANVPLSFDAGTVNVLPDITSEAGASIRGGGEIVADAAARDISWQADLCESLTVRKVGARTLTLTSSGLPNLVNEAGTIRVTGIDSTASNLTLKAGSILVVDGVTLRYFSLTDEGGEVVCLNGGRFEWSRTVDAGLTEVRRALVPDGLVKDGAGALRLYDPALTGAVHVATGSLAFSRLGLSDRFLKFTFKELLPFKDNPIGRLGVRVHFYDSDGVTSTNKEPKVNAVVMGKDPSTLAKGELTAPEGSTYDAPGTAAGGWREISAMFRTEGSGGNTPIWTTGLVTNALDDACWQTVWYRMSDALTTDFDGVNVSAAWNYANPRVWTIESSATGEAGTWRTVLDKNERCAGMDSSNSLWMNGDVTKPAYRLSYVERGVRGLADVLQAQVDAGATLDFTAKEGGQALDVITVDFARGGGVLKGARLAPSGMLVLVHATKALMAEPLPLVLEDLGDAGHLANWLLVVDGVLRGRRLSYNAEDGRITVHPNGLVLTIR